jgi:hypothetical protein
MPTNVRLLIDRVVFELESSLSYELTDDLKEFVRRALIDHEQGNVRKLEEKDVVIGELKQSLLELTEKRFRQSLTANATQQQNGTATNGGSHSQLLDLKNIEFLLGEKEAQVSMYANELRQREAECEKLKRTIQEQDNIILSHNSNLHVSAFFFR